MMTQIDRQIFANGIEFVIIELRIDFSGNCHGIDIRIQKMIQTVDVTFGIENTDIKHRVVGNDQGILQDLAEFIIVVDKFVLIFDIPLGNAVNMGIGEKVVTEMGLEVPFKVVNDLPFFIDRNAQRTGGCRTGIGRFKIESDDFHCRFFLFLSFRKRFILDSKIVLEKPSILSLLPSSSSM